MTLAWALKVTWVFGVAEVSGRIYDASNATVPKAEVVLRNRETAAEFRAVTGDAREYRVDSLPRNFRLDVA